MGVFDPPAPVVDDTSGTQLLDSDATRLNVTGQVLMVFDKAEWVLEKDFNSSSEETKTEVAAATGEGKDNPSPAQSELLGFALDGLTACAHGVL